MHLLSALDVCYGIHEDNNQLVLLATGTHVAEHLTTLYDNLTLCHPRRVLSRERLDAVLRAVDLPPIDLNSDIKFVSVNDFQRTICRQYCLKRGIEFRLPGRLTVPQIYDLVQHTAHKHTVDNTLQAVTALTQIQSTKGVEPKLSASRQQLLSDVSSENLLRTVLRQQAEIDSLKQFGQQLIDTVKDTHVQLLTALVDSQQPATQTQLIANTDLYEAVSTLQRVRCTLQQATPKCTHPDNYTPTELTQEQTTTIHEHTLSEVHVPLATVTMTEAADAEDSGWMSDDEDGLQSEMVCLGSDSRHLKHVPDLPFDATPIETCKTTHTNITSNANRELAVKKRLSSLAHKLKDTEIMLSVFLENDEQSLID